jgi:hypothetical protein
MPRAAVNRASSSEVKPTRPRRHTDALALLLLALGVLAVYCPAGLLSGNILAGGDFSSLHQRRLEFARVELFGSGHLPAWYPREFLGTPFWSNLQNFPLIPTRLPMLLLDPWHVHAVGVNLAAILAATFTHLLCRRLRLGPLGAAVAGWTFAAGGFFAARVFVGHFPLLEAYPALPLLLWLAERCVAATTPRDLRVNLAILALSAGAVMLAGHPQVPLYAVGTTMLYLAARAPLRRAGLAVGAIVAGVACASFALLPMLQLIGRSTRVLHLDPAVNDVPFPAWRLKAFAFPWADGWPAGVIRSVPNVPFTRAPQEAQFWETTVYVGWLPLLALVLLAARAIARRQMPARRLLVLGILGAAALLLAMPGPRSLLPGGPWTILRAPARQAYVTVFALSVAAGACADVLWRWAALPRTASRRRLALFGVAAVLALHFLDVRAHAVPFLRVIPYPDFLPPVGVDNVEGIRIAIDVTLDHALNRRVDDVGVFDSILLARPYRALLALSGMPPTANRQDIDGAELGTRALRWSGASFVGTVHPPPKGLRPMTRSEAFSTYQVTDPLPRAAFVPLAGAQYLDDDAVYDALRAGAQPDPAMMFLPPAARLATAPTSSTNSTAPATTPTAKAAYTRISTDEIQVEVRADGPGYLRVLEAWDPGWRASIDGQPAQVFLADGFVIAVPVDTGTHVVQLVYSTPGVIPGLLLTLAGALALGGLLWVVPRWWFHT